MLNSVPWLATRQPFIVNYERIHENCNETRCVREMTELKMSNGFRGLVAGAAAAAVVFSFCQIKVSHQSELLRRANDCCRCHWAVYWDVLREILLLLFFIPQQQQQQYTSPMAHVTEQRNVWKLHSHHFRVQCMNYPRACLCVCMGHAYDACAIFYEIDQ